MRNDFFLHWKIIKLKNFEKIKVVKMFKREITILPREDSVMEKGLKKLIKGPCPLRDMATAWELMTMKSRRSLQSHRHCLTRRFSALSYALVPAGAKLTHYDLPERNPE